MTRFHAVSVRLAFTLALSICLIAGAAAGFAQDEAAPAKKSPPAALAVYADAASFQNNKAYQLATAEWEKFIEKYPQDPLHNKATYYAGVCYLQLKNFAKAAEKFEAVVSDPQAKKFELREDAYLNAGWSQYNLASGGEAPQYEKPAATFAAMIKEFPEGKHADQALWFQGESLYRAGKKKESLAAYQQLVDNHPKSNLRTDAVYALGVTHEELGQYAEAGTVYDIFLEEFKQSDLFTEVRMRKAETLLQTGKLAEAKKIFAEVAAVEGFASADYALQRQAICAAKQEEFAEAGQLYAKLASDFPKSTYAADAVLEAGRSYYRAGDFKQAASWFNKVLEAGGASAPEAAHWLARIHLRENQPAKAAEVAGSMISQAADSQYLVNLKLDQADGLLEAGQAEKALPLFKAIAADHVDHALASQATYNAAFTALELNDYQAAKTQAAAFLEKYPQDKLVPDVKYIAAESAVQLKQYDAAEKQFNELVANYPDHSDLKTWQLRVALTSFLQKKHGETIDFLSPLLPDFKQPARVAEANYLVGVSHFSLENFGEAETKLKAALAADPQWRQADETLLFLAQAQRKNNRLDAAVQTINQLISDFPESQFLDQAHYRLAEFLYAADKHEQAAAEYDTVVSKWPESTFAPYAYYGAGWSAIKLKNYPQSIESFSALLEKYPDHTLQADSLFARTISRRLVGEFQGAIDDAEAYLSSGDKLPHKLEALYEKGQAEVGLKKYEEAVKTFSSILAAEQDHPTPDRVIYELAWAHKELEQQAKAIENFSQLVEQFPQSSLAPEARFHVAEGLYEEKKFDQAAQLYAAAKENAEKSSLEEKVTYKLGWAYYQQKDYAKALAEFDEQTTEYPQGNLFGEAMFMKAESLFRTNDFERALPAYEKAQEVLADSEKATEAVKVLMMLHGGQSAAQLKQWDKSLAMLRPITEQYPESAYAPEATYEQAWALQNQSKNDEALKLYEQAATSNRGKVGARARFMAGELQFLKKDFGAAVMEFQRVMFGYGGENAAEEVKPWQAKAGSEAGRVTETGIAAAKGQEKQALISKAKQFYQYVVEKHPQSEVAPLAKKRITELNKL